MGKRADQGGWPASGFGEQLRAVRTSKGWTQKVLADKLKVHVTTISRLERGDQEPVWPLVLSLARIAGVSADTFRPEGDATPSGPPVTEAIAKLEETIRILREGRT